MAGHPITETEVERSFKTHDLNGDGQLDFVRFFFFFMYTVPGFFAHHSPLVLLTQQQEEFKKMMLE
jgi:hypothetical protein